MALELAVRSLAGGDAALDEAVETVQAEAEALIVP